MKLIDFEPQYLKQAGKLFYNTVHNANAKDYTQTQLDAWAPLEMDLKAWQERFSREKTLLAMLEDTLVGFGSLETMDQLDCLYVHHEYQGRGVGSALLKALERFAWEQGANSMTAQVSITARPFFLYHGYQEIRSQQVERRGVPLRNFVMSHTLKG